jgi:hypothetical protein
MLHAKLTKHAHEGFRPNLRVQPSTILYIEGGCTFRLGLKPSWACLVSFMYLSLRKKIEI